MKRLASWTERPGAAIWSATVAPRLTIDLARSLGNSLIGQPLNTLLRWNQSETGELSWQSAA